MHNVDNSFAKNWFNRVWNNGDENAISRLVHPEAKIYGLGEPLIGPDQFIPFYQMFRNEYSDIHVRVDRVYNIEHTEIAMCTVTARHNASGKEVNFKGMCETVIKNGQIVEGHNLFDFLTMNVQAGKIQPEQLQ